MEKETHNNIAHHKNRQVEDYNKNSLFLTKAHDFAREKHNGQKRVSGEDYISHPKNVEKIIYEEFQISDENINAAALLHDTVEDANVTLDEISYRFNSTTSFLVDGVSKLRSEKGIINTSQESIDAKKKIIRSQMTDARVLILKISDRLHNMRTLNFMPFGKQITKARETFGYVKMAESLGMWIPALELDNLSLKYFDPKKYDKYRKIIEDDPRNKKEFVSWMKSSLETIANEAQVNASIETRMISIPTLINKLGKYMPSKVNDLISFRIVVEEDNDSKARDMVYKMLGYLRGRYPNYEDQERFDDFYSKPTDNGYSALQLTLDFPIGSVEIAITSRKKEEFNNWGVVSLMRKGECDLQKYALKLLFTPTGEIKFFPPMATGIDFAYSISPSLGARAISMLVDGVKVPISSVIPNGSEVKILIGPPRIAPPVEELEYCLPKTKKTIEEQISENKKCQLENSGEKIVSSITSRRGVIELIDLMSIDKHKQKVEDVLYKLGCKGSIKDLYYKIGSGVMDPKDFEKCLDEFNITKEQLNITSILVKTLDRPGIFADLTSAIARLGGNIGTINGLPSQKGNNKFYSIRLLVEGLDNSKNEVLLNSFIKDARFKTIIIV